MADFNRKSNIFKLVILILTIILTVCMFMFWTAATSHLDRVLVITTIVGFLLVYITLIIGVFSGNEVDRDVSAIWAWLAASCFLGVGLVLFLAYSYYTHETHGQSGMVAGFLCLVTSALCFCDLYFTSTEG